MAFAVQLAKGIFDLVRDDLALVEQEIAAQNSAAIEPVCEISSYLREGGGKRLRPALLLLAAGASGYRGESAIRLGAVVEGYDVRPETAEQVASLGATFVQTGVDARGKGGYARELTEAEKSKIGVIVTKHIQEADLIITTASIPGRPAPKLISKAQLAGMKVGAVIVDLSAEGGGNCEDTQPGATVRIGPVSIVAPLNMPSLVARDASELYARNVAALLGLMMKDNIVTLNWDDEVLAKSAALRGALKLAEEGL